ncbi:MAG: sulfate transporter ATP-binding protein [Phycisphaerales bacterium]|nr:sulfate transporter ATP-binding protein [Phycisphaerales bacterium]
MDKMVELRNVTKRFGGFVAVAGVDLDIRAGEFLTLLGPSGCGKTTLLRMISGFETPTEGSVHLAGQDVTALPPYRRDVNQVFQSYALFPHLSVADNVAFGLKMKKTPGDVIRRRVAEAIEMVSLAGFEQRKPAQLSGGQRQRVALARALVCEPKVLLLDEPLAALDAKLRRSMQIELKRLQTRLGITFLFVTHDQEEALVMSDRIAVVNKGKIEQIGGVEEIYHRPRTPFVADFIGQANILEARVLSCVGAWAQVLCRGDVGLTVAGEILAAEGTTLLSIRPEKIRLSSRRPAGENVLEATVHEEIFRGATDQLLLQTAGGFELTAIVANQSAAEEAFHQGDRVFCQLHPDDVVVLAREGGVNAVAARQT